MDGPQHFTTAEDYLLLANEAGDYKLRDYFIARATAHGALALVAAMIDTTTEIMNNDNEWREAVAHE